MKGFKFMARAVKSEATIGHDAIHVKGGEAYGLRTKNERFGKWSVH